MIDEKILPVIITVTMIMLVFTFLCFCIFFIIEKVKQNRQKQLMKLLPKIPFEFLSKDEIGNFASLYVYRETITDIIYVFVNTMYGSNFNFLVNKEGKPLLYSEWIEKNYKIEENKE